MRESLVRSLTSPGVVDLNSIELDMVVVRLKEGMDDVT
jgi:hypothetical protein